MASEAGRGLGRGFRPGMPALVTYVMAGYPNRERSMDALRAVARAGADVIELGVPYGDPLADGPVIAKAGKEAMDAAGGRFGLAETIELAREFTGRASGGISPQLPPVALMTYLNPMLKMGLPKLAEAASAAGISGFIVPDMPPDNVMATRWLAVARPLGIDTVFLATPTSTPDRLRTVAEASAGFVYCVSTTGVTGERGELPRELAALVARVREYSRLPVAVGFGISTSAQAADVAAIADGVVIGSAIVRRQADPAGLEGFVRGLSGSVHGGRSAEDV